MPVSTSTRKLFSQCRILGSGSGKVELSESELLGLMHLTISDLGWVSFQTVFPVLSEPFPDSNYYRIELNWFRRHEKTAPTAWQLLDLFNDAIQIDADFGLYFYNICSLHKRRLKYQRILSTQPKPSMDQIGPRSLIEFGIIDSNFLNSWMTWRKWIFDIDNRAAQETGYLFEPILASCLGGESIGARNSPVKRLDENGNPTNRGRQIDCYIGNGSLAYEFKLRVTIAASGQGRFAEELSFPIECKAAGLKPVLLVLDPTPSNRLDELADAFIISDGNVFIGDDAWKHMEVQAGDIMSIFLERYVKLPLQDIATHDGSEIQNILLDWSNDKIIISNDSFRYVIDRG